MKLCFFFLIHFNPYPSAGSLILRLTCDSLACALAYKTFAFSISTFSLCAFNGCTFNLCAFASLSISSFFGNYAATGLSSTLNGLAIGYEENCLRFICIGFFA